ncbi:hypothetical protein D3C85_1453730 [compost metagenome]
MRAARVGQAHGPGDFVVGLAGSIIARAPDDTELAGAFEQNELGVSAGHDERNRRIHQLMYELVGIDMSRDMVDTNQRQV